MSARSALSPRRGVAALFVALAMLTAACGDDAEPAAESDDTSTDVADGTDDEGGADTDATSDADADADTDADPDADGADDEGADDDAGGSEVVPTGELNCTELQDALQTIGDSLEFDASLAGEPAQLEASFATAQQQLDALAASAPDISEPVAAVKAGLGDLGAAFAEIGWDASTLASDPGQAASFTAQATPIVTELFAPLNTVQSYVSTNCI